MWCAARTWRITPRARSCCSRPWGCPRRATCTRLWYARRMAKSSPSSMARRPSTTAGRCRRWRSPPRCWACRPRRTTAMSPRRWRCGSRPGRKSTMRRRDSNRFPPRPPPRNARRRTRRWRRAGRHRPPQGHQELRAPRRPHHQRPGQGPRRPGSALCAGLCARPAGHHRCLRPQRAAGAGDRLRHGRGHGPHRARASRRQLPVLRGARARRGRAAQAHRRARPLEHPHPAARRRGGAGAHAGARLARRRAHLLSRPLAQEAPQQAPPDPAAAGGQAGRAAQARRLHPLRSRLAALCRADAGSAVGRAAAGQHRPGLCPPARVPAPDRAREPRHAPGPWRMGPGVHAPLTSRSMEHRPMKPLLRNLAEMTAHRDHLRLEVSVLSTLLRLGHIVQVRALELFEQDQAAMLRPRSWSQDGQVISSEHDAAGDPRRMPLALEPELAQCIAAGGASTERSAPQRHTLWLPVWLAGRATTCLEITQSRAFTQHQRDVIMGVFLVYQNYQSLLDYSERDALTGLLNRKTFEEQFARQAGSPATTDDDADAPRQWLAVIDIDHFKAVNDRFGHLYGDEVLILVANVLRTQFKSQDRIFRFGGEEFVVLLRSVTLAQTRQALERLCAAMQAHAFPQIGHITVSIGFAASQLGSPVEILGRADPALYHAKENGRNRVCFYDDLLKSGALQAKVAHDEVELF